MGGFQEIFHNSIFKYKEWVTLSYIYFILWVNPGYKDPWYMDPGYKDPGYKDPWYMDPGYKEPWYKES